jgi:hypothetical protein
LANTGRVAFYCPGFNSETEQFSFSVHVDIVSWGDDRGQAHFVRDLDGSSPDQLPLHATCTRMDQPTEALSPTDPS